MKNILLIDEDSDVLRLLRAKLYSAGYEVGLALDGAGAEAQLESFHPDVVVMETLLPDVNGLELLNQIKTNTSTPPLMIVLSSKGDVEDIAAAFDSGADDYVTKPFSPISLLERIRINLIRNMGIAMSEEEQ